MNMMMLTIAAVAAAPAVGQAVPAPPAPSVEIRSDPDGGLSGRVTSGGLTSDVQAGQRTGQTGSAPPARVRCPPGSVGRSVRVVSPDGTSSASSSVSTSGNGVASAAGTGSPGSRIVEESCGADAPPKRGRSPARTVAPH